MLIQKDYKFYAAHRNEELQDKCRNLHGHRYGVRCFFEVERNGSRSYTQLFGEFDGRLEPFFKAEYDHGMLINVHDPLYETLCQHMERTGEQLKLKVFPRPTSVENLAFQLFTEITDMGFTLERLEIRETDTSVVSYTREDWVADSRRFAQPESQPRLRSGGSEMPVELQGDATRQNGEPNLPGRVWPLPG
jgi:6-pyruvoyltetrahydropterin/6-carboxytetrahydropterin synthase